MRRVRLFAALVLLAAVLLHLPGHLSVRAPHAKQTLPEDGPALTTNPALAPVGREPTLDVLARAISDPASAWYPGGESIGATRHRPLGTALLALVRTAAGASDAHRLAGALALLLHALLAWLTFRLVLAARGPPAAALLAGLLVAASPHLGVAVGWPARLPVIAAALLAVLSVLTTHSAPPGSLDSTRPDSILTGGGMVRAAAGGLLAAAAALFHEVGFGAGLALAALALSGTAPVRGRLARTALVVLPSAAAFWFRSAALTAATPAAAGPLDVFDAGAGVLAALLAPLAPARLHVAADVWSANGGARIGAAVVLAAAVAALWRARAAAPSRLGLAAIASALPVLGVVWWGGSPHLAWYAALAWPLTAAALGTAFVAAIHRGGALRPAAAVCAALLVAATVAATVRAAPDYRVRSAFVERALRADPDAPVARAWRIGDRLLGSPEAAGESGAARAEAESLAAALVTSSRELTEPAERLVGDRTAAATVSSVLAEYVALGIAASKTGATGSGDSPSDDGTWAFRLERPALAAALVNPGWSRGWLVLADVQTALGGHRAVAGALGEARKLLPDDVDLAVAEGRALLSLGLTGKAVTALGDAYFREVQRAEAASRPPALDLALALVDALTLEAQASGNVSAYREGAGILRGLFERGERGGEIRRVAYDLYLDYGDTLASLDRPALARSAYQRAAGLTSPDSKAQEHLVWLEARLTKERRKAADELAMAQAGNGNIANALLGVAIVTARGGDWKQADEMFNYIASQQGGWNGALRFARAVHMYAAHPDRLEQAESELRLVLEEDPRIVDARYELGLVLVQLGRLREAADELTRAATDGADREWAVEAVELAERIESALWGR